MDQLALIISIISVAVASSALGWNVYRDVVLKPKVVVSFSVVFIIHESLPHKPQYLSITATNFGPGLVTMNTIFAKKSSLWRRLFRKVELTFITPDNTNPLSAQLPAKIDMGDKVQLFLPYNANCLLKNTVTHVGLTDFYGRVHWAPGRELRKAYSEWHKDFAPNA